MIRRAQAMGLAAIGFADHVTPYPVRGCPFYAHQRLHILSDLWAEIDEINGPADLEILVGLEADYAVAGRACLNQDVLALADHVIGSASHFHLPAAAQPTGDGPAAKAELMVRLAREVLALPGVSVWAHPFHCNRMRPLSPILATVSDADFAALIRLANQREIAVEVNGSAARHDEYRAATARFYSLAHEMGARFTVTADAHHPDHFSRLDPALEWALTLGIRDADFLTVQELRERQSRKTAAP